MVWPSNNAAIYVWHSASVKRCFSTRAVESPSELGTITAASTLTVRLPCGFVNGSSAEYRLGAEKGVSLDVTAFSISFSLFLPTTIGLSGVFWQAAVPSAITAISNIAITFFISEIPRFAVVA